MAVHKKKYIIELPENTHWIQWIMEGTKDHHPYMDYKQMEDLTPYTEPDTEAIRKKAYEQGAEDMREALRVLIDTDEDCFTIPDVFVAFGEGSYHAVVRKHQAMEILEKIRVYKQEQKKQEEIQVGDEMIRHYKNEFMEGDDAPSIFLSEEDGCYRCLFWTGCTFITMAYPKEQFKRTGRHFPEIAEVLKKMREE